MNIGDSVVLRDGVSFDGLPPSLVRKIGQIGAIETIDGVEYINVLYAKQHVFVTKLPAEMFEMVIPF